MQRQLVALAFIWLLVTPAPAIFQASRKNQNKKAPAAHGAGYSASGPDESKGLLKLGGAHGSGAFSDKPADAAPGLVRYATTMSRLLQGGSGMGADGWKGYVALGVVDDRDAITADAVNKTLGDRLKGGAIEVGDRLKEGAIDTAADSDAIFSFLETLLDPHLAHRIAQHGAQAGGLDQAAMVLSGSTLGIGGLIIAGKGFHDTFKDMIETNGDSVDIGCIVDLQLGVWGAALGGMALATFPPGLALVGLGVGASAILHRVGRHFFWSGFNPEEDGESQFEIEELLHKAVAQKIHAGFNVADSQDVVGTTEKLQRRVNEFMVELEEKLNAHKLQYPEVVGMSAFFFHAKTVHEERKFKNSFSTGGPLPFTQKELIAQHSSKHASIASLAIDQEPVLGINVRHSMDGVLPCPAAEASLRFGKLDKDGNSVLVTHSQFRFSNSQAVRDFGTILDTQMVPTDVRPFIQLLSGGKYKDVKSSDYRDPEGGVRSFGFAHGEGGVWGRRNRLCFEACAVETAVGLKACAVHGVARGVAVDEGK